MKVLQSVDVKRPDADALAFWKSDEVAIKVGIAVAPVPLLSTVFAPAVPNAVVIAVAPEPVTAPVRVIVWFAVKKFASLVSCDVLIVEVAKLYSVPPLPPINPPNDATFIVFENWLSVPLKVLLSPRRVDEAAVPDDTLIVTGEAPSVAKVAQVALPVQVTVVVGVLAIVLLLVT